MQASLPSSDLKKKAVRGGLVTMTAQAATILVQLISLVVLSRLLPPSDFGVIAMITALTSFMALFRDMGLSTASIQSGGLSRDQTSALFWLNAAAGLVLTLLVAALAPAVAWFYGRPELQPVTLLISTTILVSSLGAQHSATMQRELRFKPKAIADISGAVSNLIVSIALAHNDWGFWALAWGTVVGAAVTTALYFLLSGFRPSWPRRASGIRELLGFGANVTGFELVNYFHRNLDNVLIGRFWGAIELGLYSRAYQMMMLPITSLRTPINAVAFPVLSRLRSSPEEFRRYYGKIATLLAFISMPLMAFLTVNAHDVVEIALGPAWKDVAPIFVMLGITGFIQPVASLRGLVMLSQGHSRRYLAWGLYNAIVVSIAFCAGTPWGAIGVATAYALSNYLILYPSLLFAFKDSPLKSLDFFSTIALPATSSLVAAIASWLSLPILSKYGSIISISASFLIFCCAFTATTMLIPGGYRTIASYVRIAAETIKPLTRRRA